MFAMSRMILPALALSALGVSASASSLVAAPSYTYNFSNITGNSATNAAAGESQLKVTVQELMAGSACFTFTNEGMEPMSITSIYFEDLDGSVSGEPYFAFQSLEVDYEKNEGNLNLPGGNQPSVNFEEAFGVEPTSKGGFAKNGVGVGEVLTVCYDLTTDFDAVIAALDNGSRIGIHVQAFGDGGSEAFVTTPPTTQSVPTPSAALAGIGLMGLLAGRRRRQQEAE